MTQTKTKTKTPTPGFAVKIGPDTDLGLGILIVEDEEGNYEPLAVVATIEEALELKADDLKRRLDRLEHDEDPGLCPYEYKVYARGMGGDYQLAARWMNV